VHAWNADLWCAWQGKGSPLVSKVTIRTGRDLANDSKTYLVVLHTKHKARLRKPGTKPITDDEASGALLCAPL
jgi:hypothetical protein